MTTSFGTRKGATAPTAAMRIGTGPPHAQSWSMTSSIAPENGI